jgi:hypothetical protein
MYFGPFLGEWYIPLKCEDYWKYFVHVSLSLNVQINNNICNMTVFSSLDLLMVYIPEGKQQIRSMK